MEENKLQADQSVSSLGIGIGFSDTHSEVTSTDTFRTGRESQPNAIAQVKKIEFGSKPSSSTVSKIKQQTLPKLSKSKPRDYKLKHFDDSEDAKEHKELEKQIQDNNEDFQSKLKFNQE